jgi:hypothetical protein
MAIFMWDKVCINYLAPYLTLAKFLSTYSLYYKKHGTNGTNSIFALQSTTYAF